jgi:hypothetical protein
MSRVFWSIGCIAACILSWYFLLDGSWRKLLFILSLLGFFSLYAFHKNGRESPRYLIMMDKM